MLKKIQRFGGAMMTPVLLFAFTGLVVGLTGVLKIMIFKDPEALVYKLIQVVEAGGWTVFNQMALLFAISLPIGLAKKAHARACMETFAIYCTFNYFVAEILKQFNLKDMSGAVGGTTGLAFIAGIKTLDTNLFGAIIIAGIAVWIHNKFFDKKLPDFLGIFQGSVFVYMVGFFVMLPVAAITVLVWPQVQAAIESLQVVLVKSGVFGVWIYTFLERILIPTGLHHFVYTPFVFGPAVVEGGIQTHWLQNVSQYAAQAGSVKDMFPAGGFALHGNSKIFGAAGIALAMYATAKPEKKKLTAGLLIPVVFTAMISGITEPLEFTFLFIAPVLFAVHSVLAATMSATMYAFGVVGNMGGGLLDFLFQNWMPMAKNHFGMIITQIVIGVIFTAIYFFVFKFLIQKMNLKTPGREDDDEEAKLYTKAEYRARQEGGSVSAANGQDALDDQALIILEALGGKENIEELNNCATRLRVSVKDESKVAPDSVFKQAGAHGVVRKGKAFQVIIGLTVSSVKESIQELMNK